MTVYAGNKVVIKIGGSPIHTTETLMLKSGNTYQISDQLKTIIDPNKPVIVTGDGTFKINYTKGLVDFDKKQSIAPTIDYYYVPTTKVAKGTKYSLKKTAEPLDITEFGDDFKRETKGLTIGEGSFTFLSMTDTYFDDVFHDSSLFLMEMYTNSEDKNPQVFWATIDELTHDVDVSNIQNKEVSFTTFGEF